MITLLFVLLPLSSWTPFDAHAANPDSRRPERIRLSHADGKVEITTGDRKFATYDYSSYRKPIFYPVLGPKQVPLTRNFPMRDVAGESHDHPHHKSMWIGHQINGVDFWSEEDGSVRLQNLKVDEGRCLFQAQHHWIADDSGKVVVSDETEVRFGSTPTHRLIDFRIRFVADHGDVTFDDTKEGFFALRLHPALRLEADPQAGVNQVTGYAVNDRGDSDQDVWGKSARWVDYSGTINDIACGVAIFDHPSNLRHPTTWHARGYGLFAANPFGLHHFQNSEQGRGAHLLKQGHSLTFRYRVVLHLGSAEVAGIANLYQQFLSGK
jgi:hypothetical protein